MTSSKYPEAAFLADMTASATHEVRNVLAIIKESAGLVEDLVQVYGARGALDEDKVRRAVHRIETQIKRGADLLTHLNRLAHTLDQDLTKVELGRELEQLVFLSQRFARQRGHQVRVDDDLEECWLNVNSLLLHMALHEAMQCCLEELPEGSRVTVGAGREGPAVVAEFRGASEPGNPGGGVTGCHRWEELVRLADLLGGATVEGTEAGYGIRILFRDGTRGP
jgi:C4-dicarboxylate-specific signal transduction histidine kinase